MFVSDRLAFGMFILFPFLFIIMFSLSMGNVGPADNRIELHIATQENDGVSTGIIQSIATNNVSELSPGAPVIVWEKDFERAKANVTAGKLDGFLAFPADFTANIMAGKPTGLEIIARATATDKRMALNGLAQAIASGISSTAIETATVERLMAGQGKSPAEIQQAVGKIIQAEMSGANAKPLITTASQKAGDVKPVNGSSYVVPGYLVMFVFFAAAMGSIAIIQARQNHTLERMLASSVKKEAILGGFFLGGIFRGLLQIAIFWTMGLLVFRVDVGVSPLAVVGLSLLTVLMAAGFSLLLATLAKTDRSASALGVLASLVLAPLGGCWWPLFITPMWMQTMAKFTPHGWANDGFNKLMLFGATGSDVTINMLALLGFTVVFVVVAVLRFRTSE